MCSQSAIFIALASFVILFCDSTSSSECTQLGPCVCLLPDGYYYNMTRLANEKPFTDTKENVIVSFHPCTNVKIGNDTCGKGDGVSLCLQSKEANKTSDYNLGTIEETRMTFSHTNNFPIFEIHHENVTSYINIVCATYNETSFTIQSSTVLKPNATRYHFQLSSPYACKIEPQRGLSTGSVLVILFFIFAGIYFIGGAIALKTLRGATGWEMLPNHDFWFELPSLVRDGIVFIFNCCRANSYERI